MFVFYFCTNSYASRASWNLIWGIPSWLFLLWCFINVGYSKIIITENQVILKLLLIGKPKILNLEDVDYICKDGKFGFYYLGTNKPVKPKKIILNVKEMDELIVEIVKRASPIGVDLVIKNRIEKYQFQKQGMIKLQ